MATLQQQRQAIAAGMAASRAPTGQAERQAAGQAMERNRRGAGQAMIEQRTGQSVAADINRLTDPRPPRRTLRPVEPVGALPPSRGRGVYKAPPTTGGGIAGPLQETSRTYASTPEFIESIDGRGYWRIRRVESITIVDANGNEVVFNSLQAPPII
ncbi:hypothetical protein [Stutzerimonas nitrititolerans]|uniref:hypothetical protein n=1 Tax=Stutzerimonas nitrititolerans TaxID=2482751 RepID=UPI00289E1D27|nr:hypothetical protein [Stutzerimonas nitrititolerans]